MKIPSFLLFSVLALQACDKASKPSHSKEVAVKGLHAAALSETGDLAVVGSIYHGGSLWRTLDDERLFNWNHRKEEQTTIVAADFSDDGRWALTADPHTLVLWDTQTGKGERFWTAPGEILDAELSSNGQLALLGLSDHTAVVFDVQKGGIRQTLPHTNRVRSVDFSENDRLIITGSEDYSATVWQSGSDEALTRIQHDDDVQFVKLSDDGSLALSVSKYDKALVWKPSSGELVGELQLKAEHLRRGIRFTAARFSRDNQQLLTGRPDQIVQLWDVSTLKERARWKLPKRDSWKPTSSAVLDVSFTDNSSTYRAAASNGFIHTLALDNTQNN